MVAYCLFVSPMLLAHKPHPLSYLTHFHHLTHCHRINCSRHPHFHDPTTLFRGGSTPHPQLATCAQLGYSSPEITAVHGVSGMLSIASTLLIKERDGKSPHELAPSLQVTSPTNHLESPVVMCRLRLGLEAPALAWLWAAQASGNREPGQKPKIWLGPAWLWPEPRLLVE
jgi:hypothetical protein